MTDIIIICYRYNIKLIITNTKGNVTVTMIPKTTN